LVGGHLRLWLTFACQGRRRQGRQRQGRQRLGWGLPWAVAGMLLRALGARLRPGASVTAWCVGGEPGLCWGLCLCGGPGLCWGPGGAVVANYSL